MKTLSPQHTKNIVKSFYYFGGFLSTRTLVIFMKS